MIARVGIRSVSINGGDELFSLTPSDFPCYDLQSGLPFPHWKGFHRIRYPLPKWEELPPSWFPFPLGKGLGLGF